jgi:hypothetical protein
MSMDGRIRELFEGTWRGREVSTQAAQAAWRVRLGPLVHVVAVFALALGLGSQGASAQTISDGDVSFERTASSFDATPAGNFRGVTATLTSDQVFETGWAYRLGGDTREFFFPTPSTQNFAGAVSTITWSDVAGRGVLSARETVRVIDRDGGSGPSPSGQVEMTMQVTNISAAPVTVGLFHMADLDVAGNGANDTVVLLRPGPSPTLGIADGAVSAQYRGIDANRWQVRNFNTGSGIGGLLNDTDLTTLSNSGAPAGPSDFTGGMQWNDRTVQPGASFSVTATFAVNASVIEPELFAIKSNDVNGVTSVDDIFDWTIQLINANNSPIVTFSPGQILLRDQLPGSGIVYDAAVVTPIFGTTGTVDCVVAVADLVCTAVTAVSIPGAASLRVVLPAGPTAAGTFTNPRPGGSCLVDPDNHIDEEVETNNGCVDTVTVLGTNVFEDGFETLLVPRF